MIRDPGFLTKQAGSRISGAPFASLTLHRIRDTDLHHSAACGNSDSPGRTRVNATGSLVTAKLSPPARTTV
jgi:hypothetical protein